MEYFNKKLTPNIHLHEPSPYASTKKVSHKVKYLLTTLMQDENRERINIYLKIFYRNRNKMYLRNLYTVLYELLGNSIKIWGKI